MWSGGPQPRLLLHIMTNTQSQTWHRWVSGRLWWKQLFKPFILLTFPGRVLRLRQSVFVAVWVGFLSARKLEPQSNINIRCDQSAWNPKQTAEPCWDVSFLKRDNVGPQVNHSTVCLFFCHGGKFPTASPLTLQGLLQQQARTKANAGRH